MLSRVFGIKKDGTISELESYKRNHNDISKDLYSEYVSSLTSKQKEIAEGAVKSHWPIAGAVVKNRKDLIFLELLGEELETPICISLVPTEVSNYQRVVAKKRYESSDMRFMDVTNCNGSEFVNHIDCEPFDSLFTYLSSQYEKESDMDMV